MATAADHSLEPTIPALPSKVTPPVALPELDDRALPEHLRVPLSPMRRSLSDALSRRIAHLLHLHPNLDRAYRDYDLLQSPRAERLRVLQEIEAHLGLSPANPRSPRPLEGPAPLP